ncbi:MAG TPA: hypothetical protein VHC97_14955 [Thermoanaerobaculia bacterium]|nr:hypothetical protein [Thermoanaerobaculia bacterium]
MNRRRDSEASRLRIREHRAQLSFGDGSVVVTERRAGPGSLFPGALSTNGDTL